MARKKVTIKKRAYPRGIILILDAGRDFFGELDGGVTENLDLLQRAWADPEIRQQVHKRHAAKHPEGGQPWAARKFGIGK